MSRLSVYFACLLFMMTVIAASAQEETVVVNLTNASEALNNTLNNSASNVTLNESTIVPAAAVDMTGTAESPSSALVAATADVPINESEPSLADNETAPAEPLASPESIAPMTVSGDAGGRPETLALGGSNLITKPEKPVYAIGTAARTSGIFSIGKEYLPDQAYDAGMSAETIMDLSALPFYANHM